MVDVAVKSNGRQGEGERGWVKLMVGIKERTWDEYQLRYESVELLYRTPETNITLLH